MFAKFLARFLMNISPLIISEKKGTWFAIISGLLYGLLGYFGMTIMQSGLSVYNLSFWRFSTAFLFLVTIFICKAIRKPGSLSQLLNVMINGAIFYSAPSILFFIASRYIGTGQAMVIFFVYPAFVMVLNWAFENQPIKPHYFLSFALILVGLTLLVDIGEVSLDFVGIGLSLLASLSYAIYIVMSKKTTLTALSSTLMVSLGCAITSSILGLIDNSLIWPNQFEQWLNILGIGIICSALPILLLLEAMRHISSDQASLLSVLEPVFTVIFGVILLGEVINLNTIFGIVLTLVGAMSVTIKWNGLSVGKVKKPS